jgi:hypothetical protein
MKKVIAVCVLIMMFLCVQSFGAVIIDVYASSAPNAYGSPSWAGYTANALYALENGLSVYGDREVSPTAYTQADDVVDAWEIAVTSFKSWRGDVNPTGAFANELGNRMHFGLHAYGDGTTQFCLEDITFEFHSSDPTDTLGFTGDFLNYSYNGTTRYGINWGADRVKGGGDDVVYVSGNGKTLVDEIVYVGVGNAWWPGGSLADRGLSDPQGAMDEYLEWILSEEPINITCTYYILGSSGSDMVTVIPEPATLSLLALGALSLIRRKK